MLPPPLLQGGEGEEGGGVQRAGKYEPWRKGNNKKLWEVGEVGLLRENKVV